MSPGCVSAPDLLRQPRRLADLAEIARRLGCFRAGQQIGIDERAGTGTVDIRQQSAAGIGCDLGDRFGARAEAESMQRERRLCLGIKRHVDQAPC